MPFEDGDDFHGHYDQMPPEDVVKTKIIASLRIHVEQAIHKIKLKFRIWDRVRPLPLFPTSLQMRTVFGLTFCVMSKIPFYHHSESNASYLNILLK